MDPPIMPTTNNKEGQREPESRLSVDGYRAITRRLANAVKGGLYTESELRELSDDALSMMGALDNQLEAQRKTKPVDLLKLVGEAGAMHIKEDSFSERCLNAVANYQPDDTQELAAELAETTEQLRKALAGETEVVEMLTKLLDKRNEKYLDTGDWDQAAALLRNHGVEIYAEDI